MYYIIYNTIYIIIILLSHFSTDTFRTDNSQILLFEFHFQKVKIKMTNFYHCPLVLFKREDTQSVHNVLNDTCTYK